ncbi:MAG: SDR family NAD(P)-dependent oxidoreductase [Gallionella sp.]
MASISKSFALVTGATGFIGRRLAERLLEEGWSVRLLVRDPGRLAATLRPLQDIVVGDLLDANSVGSAVKDVDIIFHCAANVSTWDAWESYYAANVLGVKNLMDSIAKENPGLSRLVHLSTVDVYGFPVLPCDEKCNTTGSGFGYGETKLLGESLVKEYGDKNNIPYTIIRPANVIGPGSQFITRIGHELQSGIMLTVDGGRANAGLLYIDNLVDDMIWAAGAVKALGQVYNVRDDYDVTWKTFLTRFRAAIKGKGIIVDLPFPIADAVAGGFEAISRVLFPSKEPLLHRLLVRFFGRTCGHSAAKIRSDRGGVQRIGFDEAMERSCRWFLDDSRSRR